MSFRLSEKLDNISSATTARFGRAFLNVPSHDVKMMFHLHLFLHVINYSKTQMMFFQPDGTLGW